MRDYSHVDNCVNWFVFAEKAFLANFNQYQIPSSSPPIIRKFHSSFKSLSPSPRREEMI